MEPPRKLLDETFQQQQQQEIYFRRLQQFINHLRIQTLESSEGCQSYLISAETSSECRSKHRKLPDDIVIVSSLRTPICKARKGSFKDTHPTDLLASVLKGILVRSKINVDLIEDIIVGNVLPPGGGAKASRMAMFLAGYPDSIPISTINRQCASGLQAFVAIAGEISMGLIRVGIACGVESMSFGGNTGPLGEINPKVLDHWKAKDCLIPMGQTSENVARRFGIGRESQDRYACDSHAKAFRAQKEGRFKEEIIPVVTSWTNEKGEMKSMVVTEDDGIRPSSLSELSKLKPSFAENGLSTAGNSSQISDGASALLVMKRSTAEQLGISIEGVFRSFSVCGVPPDIMGIGPAIAIPKALEKAGLMKEDIDIFELNEAFASQAIYCIEKLGLPVSRVNPNGGAIALGHPLGCTGTRQITTLLHELKRTNGRYGMVSMCIGTGMGAAAVFEVESRT